jgi:multiple sugar transport system permease protein
VIFSTLGLIDNLLSLVVADSAFAMPIALWVIKGAMDSIPRELDEAGLVDGGSSFSVLLRVIMPLVGPAIAAAAIIVFFFGWNDFLFANTFMVTESRWTVTKGLASLFGQYTVPIPFIMASAVLFSIPPVLFFLLLQRRIVSGLTAGAVKT